MVVFKYSHQRQRDREELFSSLHVVCKLIHFSFCPYSISLPHQCRKHSVTQIIAGRLHFVNDVCSQCISHSSCFALHSNSKLLFFHCLRGVVSETMFKLPFQNLTQARGGYLRLPYTNSPIWVSRVVILWQYLFEWS